MEKHTKKRIFTLISLIILFISVTFTSVLCEDFSGPSFDSFSSGAWSVLNYDMEMFGDLTPRTSYIDDVEISDVRHSDFSVYNFETNTQGWADKGKIASAVQYAGDSAKGSGSLQCTISGSGSGFAYVDIVPFVNLSDKILSIWVKFPATAEGDWMQMYLKEENGTWHKSQIYFIGTDIPTGTWTKITWSVDYLSVRRLGIEIYGSNLNSGTFLIDAYDWNVLPWLHVEGTQIVDSSGNPVILRGVAVPDPCWIINYSNHPNERDFEVLRNQWNVNVVKIVIRPGDWNRTRASYFLDVDEVIDWCVQNDMYAMLCWQAKGNPITGKSYNSSNPMEEEWTPNFSLAKDWWENAAKRYKDNPRVLYDIFSEPAYDNDGVALTWDQWKPLAEELISIIRSHNPKALIFVSGVNFAKDFRGVRAAPIEEKNIVYAGHIYEFMLEELLDEYWYFVSENHPFIVGEWGYTPAEAEDGKRESYAEPLFARIENRMLPWIAWIWSDDWRVPMITNWSTYATTDFGDYAKWKLTTPFTTSVSSSSGVVLQGNSTTTTVSVRQIEDYSLRVNLSAEDVPLGVTINFSQPSDIPSFSSIMTISVGSSVSVGRYIFPVTGTGADGKVNTCKYKLTVLSTEDPSVYNFENGTQGWTHRDKVINVTSYTRDAALGSKSLQCTIGSEDKGQVFVQPEPSVDLSNATISVWIKFLPEAAEGRGPQPSGLTISDAVVQLYLKNGSSWTWVDDGPWYSIGSAALPIEEWIPLTWSGVSYKDVRELGIQIYTNATHAPDWDSGTFLIDSYDW
jgi:hypothetical protein